MRKKFTMILAILATAILAAVLTGCGKETVISAYDIAVKNGFDGTETEWLDSLHGRDGLDGRDGQNGRDGTDLVVPINEWYNAAKGKGYEGSIVDFMKEIGNVSLADNSYVADKILLSSVVVTSGFTVTKTDFFGQRVTSNEVFSGAGVIYHLNKEKGNADIITNFHVVYNEAAGSRGIDKISEDIGVYLYGSRLEGTSKIKANFIGGSADYDIAVLRVDNSDILRNSPARRVDVADSDEISLGETAIAAGFPDGKSMSMTCGTISVDSEYIQIAIGGGKLTPIRVMRTDTAVNSGNSGGGLFNKKGQLIGIVNAKNIERNTDNIGYAIPSNTAIVVAENILFNCKDKKQHAVRMPFLGVTTKMVDSKCVYDENEHKVRIVETVKIEKVDEGALAEGKLEEGDVILSAAIYRGEEKKEIKKEIKRMYQFKEFLIETRAGDLLKVKVLRDGKETEADIQITGDKLKDSFV